MAAQIQLNDEITTCQQKLQRYAHDDKRIQLHFLGEQSQSGERPFELKRQDSQFKLLTPILHGTLSPQQGRTLLKGEFYPNEFGLGLLSLWCLGLAFLVSLGVVGRFVSSLRAQALGYVSDASGLPVALLGLPLVGLGVIWLAWHTQQADQQYLVEWLVQCFQLSREDTKVQQWTNRERSLRVKRLLKTIVGVASFGSALGLCLGLIGDIEDNLPPLKITVTEVQMCAVADATTKPTPQEIFSAHQDVYVCGYLQIETVDQRKIEIPLVFTWYYDLEEAEARAVEYVFDSEGAFTALLAKPASGTYRPGQYHVSVARAKVQLAKRHFEILVE
jgi:hypothetical protein